MKRIFLLLLPLALAAAAVAGLSVFFRAQKAQAAPQPVPVTAPLYDTPPPSATLFLGDPIYVSTADFYLGDNCNCPNGNDDVVEFTINPEAQLYGVLTNRMGYCMDDSSAFCNVYQFWFYETDDWGSRKWKAAPHLGDWVMSCNAVIADLGDKTCTELGNDVESLTGFEIDSINNLNQDTWSEGVSLTLGFRGQWSGCDPDVLNEEFIVYPVYYDVYTDTTLTPCVEDYVQGDVVVEATVQGDDEDGNVHELTEGQYYHIESSGGPWYPNPIIECDVGRYDLAMSWDGSDWQHLMVFDQVGCLAESTAPYVSAYFSVISSSLHIRVNDTGVFSDNSGSMDYTIRSASISETVGLGNCADYYTLEEPPIYTGTIPAQWGGQQLPYLDGDDGQWYAIETTDGPWRDNAPGPHWDSYNMDLTAHYHAPEWELINEDGTIGMCYEDLEDGGDWPGHWRVYVQPRYIDNHYGLRVHDQDDPDNFDDNTGSMGYEIYNATYSAPSEPCEALYQNASPESTIVIHADRINGYDWLGWWPQDHFRLQVRGGPWYEGPGTDDAYYDLQISDDGGESWYDLLDYPGIDCIGYYDANHPRIYLKPVSGNEYKFRVADQDTPNDFTDNHGVMYIDVSVIDFIGVNPGDTCENFSVGATIVSGTVDAGNEVGQELPALTDATMYALETWNGPWVDGATGSNMYGGQVTQDGYWSAILQTWYPFDEYPGAACVEDVDANHVRIYFQGIDGRDYLVRADTTEPTHPNNSGNMGYKLSGVTYTPPGSCEEDYTHLSHVVESGQIYAHAANGVQIGETLVDAYTGSLPAGTYRLDVFGGPWYINAIDEDGRYDTEISHDDGASWEDYDADYSGSLCFVEGVGDGYDGYWGHLYFQSDGTKEYRMRVDDTPPFTDNFGSMMYFLKADQALAGIKPGESGPPGWASGCYQTCYRPTSILQVANWLEYGRCELFKWFSWCPWHSDALSGIAEQFMSREPFASIYEMVGIVDQVEAEIDSYDYSTGAGGMGGYGSVGAAGEGGGDAGGVIDSLQVFASIPEDSPYNSGEIDVFPSTTSSPYGIMCQHQMIQVVGTRMATGMCWGMNVVDQIGYLAWMQLIYDLSVIIIFVLYVYSRFLK